MLPYTSMPGNYHKWQEGNNGGVRFTAIALWLNPEHPDWRDGEGLMVIFSMVKTIVKNGELVSDPEWVNTEPHGRHLCEHAIIHNKWIVHAIMRDHDIWSHDHDTFSAVKSSSPSTVRKGGPGTARLLGGAASARTAEPRLLTSIEVEVADPGKEGVSEDDMEWLPATFDLYEQDGGWLAL